MTKLIDSFKNLLGYGNGEDILKKPMLKKINMLLIVASAGVLLIILANAFGGNGTGSGSGGTGTGSSGIGLTNNAQKSQANSQDADTTTDMSKLESNLSDRLEQVLSQIEGVGNIKVTVNLASTTQKDYAINTSTNNKTTQERDQKGGNRTITETNENGQMVLVREQQDSHEEPVVVKEIKPDVKGVIVVADGADDPVVKSELMNAVHIYLDLPLYKVVVLPKESR